MAVIVEKIVDHEGDKILREKEAGRLRKLEANERKKQELELARIRKAEAEGKSYATLFKAQEIDKKEKQAAGKGSDGEEDGFDSDEDFM